VATADASVPPPHKEHSRLLQRAWSHTEPLGEGAFRSCSSVRRSVDEMDPRRSWRAGAARLPSGPGGRPGWDVRATREGGHQRERI